MDYPEDHEWWTLTSTYANVDSEITIALWQVLLESIVDRKLGAYYTQRQRAIRPAFLLEQRGVTVSSVRVEKLKREYTEDAEVAGKRCLNIAERLGAPVELAARKVNQSIERFCFGTLGLEPMQNPNGKSKTGNPSLCKDNVDHYLRTLPRDEPAYSFLNNLNRRSKKLTRIEVPR